MDILYIDGMMPLNIELSYLGYIYNIASLLKEKGYKFKILNIGMLKDFSIDCLIAELNHIKFKSIGMTTNAENIRYVYKICKALKKAFPEIPIILGGPEVTYSDVQTLKNCSCDIVIRKEGEYKTVLILDYITGKGISLNDIKGITYKAKSGEIIQNEDTLKFEIDDLPTPSYDVLTKKKYWIRPSGCTKTAFDKQLHKIRKAQQGYIMTGHGCPYRCSFCVEGITKHKKTSYLSPEKVRRNLDFFLKTFHEHYVGIADDTFTSSVKRVKEVCEVFKDLREKYKFCWYAEGRVDVLSKNLEMIKVMYDAGLRRLQIGIESGNQNVLNAYNKLITIDQIMAVLKEVAKYPDLEVVGNVIIGNPFESADDFIKSVETLKEMYVSSDCKLHISSSFLTPFHGTPIRLNPDKFGIEILVDDFEFSESRGMDEIICKPHGASVDELRYLYRYLHSNIDSWNYEFLFREDAKKTFERVKGMLTSHTPFGQTFGKLYTFQRYMNLVKYRLIIAPGDFINKDYDLIFPMRLWELEYENKECFYTSKNGERIIIDGYKSYLWDLATGNNSLKDISEIASTQFPISTSMIIDFYSLLESNLAIVFKKYDLKTK